MDLFSLETLAYFRRAQGQRLLEMAASLAGDEWQAQAVLREQFPAPLCRAALALVQLREAAKGKFTMADRMFMDREGLEMASREEVARYRAWRLREAADLLDLCCGIGGDLLALARQARVCAVDWDRRRLEMARMNAAVAGLQGTAFVQADVRDLRVLGRTVFVDPSRRQAGVRTRRAGEYSPPLSWIEQVRRVVPALAVKVSPAIAESEIPSGCEVEFLSSDHQCREASLYFGSLATAGRRATVLPGPHTIEAGADRPAPVGPPGPFVYDPDPAVVRSHLLDELAGLLDAWKLDAQVAYLSSQRLSLTPFAQSFRLLCTQPFHVRRLRQFLLGAGLYPAEVKKRRFPVEPEELRRLLDLEPGGRRVVLILTRIAGKPVVLVCARETS